MILLVSTNSSPRSPAHLLLAESSLDIDGPPARKGQGDQFKPWPWLFRTTREPTNTLQACRDDREHGTITPVRRIIKVEPCAFTLEEGPPPIKESLPTISQQKKPVDGRIIKSLGQPLENDHILTVPKTIPPGAPDKKKVLVFAQVQIRQHSITLGENNDGGRLQIQLDWPHTCAFSISIDDWERKRLNDGRFPRGKLPRLGVLERRRRLRRVAGVTYEDLLLLDRLKVESKYIDWHRSRIKTLYPEKIRFAEV